MWSIDGDLEAWLHDHFAEDRIAGEWFRPNKLIVAFFAHFAGSTTGNPELDRIYEDSFAALLLRKRAALLQTSDSEVGRLKEELSKAVGWFCPQKATYLGTSKTYELVAKDLYAIAFGWEL